MKRLILLATAALLGACQSTSPAAKASLDGEVFYLQRIALPPAATLSVTLQDVSWPMRQHGYWPSNEGRSRARYHCPSISTTIRPRSSLAIPIRSARASRSMAS